MKVETAMREIEVIAWGAVMIGLGILSIVKNCEDENREPTNEEQRILDQSKALSKVIEEYKNRVKQEITEST